MPRNINLKPLIMNTKKCIEDFRQDYDASLNSDDQEIEIDETYRTLVEKLHRNLEDFQDYQKQQLNEVNIEIVDDQLLEDVVSSIFNIEENDNIRERAERVRVIKNSLFWEQLKEFEGQLDTLEEEARHIRIDDVDADSSSRGY